ncbi:hypothetical protein ACJ41O_010610 [Fusarium nematophilum]
MGTRDEREKVYNPQPDQLDRARRKLSTVTTCSVPGQRASRSGDVDIEAQTPPSEFGECPICIGPLIPEPVHTADNDPRPTLDQVATVTSKKPSTSQEAEADDKADEANGAAAQSNETNDDDEEDDILTLNSCGHSFHSKCLSSWFLIERHDCPVCRVPYYKGCPRRERGERTLTVPPFF